MRTPLLIGIWVAGSIALAGCSSKNEGGETANGDGNSNAEDAPDTEADDDNDGGSGSGGNDGNESNPADDDNGSSGAGGTGNDETGSNDDNVGFIQDPDGGGVNIECDVWAQDCEKGEKCMPWANDGGSAWNATRCSPLDANPAQVGDPCTVEGNGISGIDNCTISSMCWNVDPETNMGTCIPFCSGSEANPICEDPTTQCAIANEGVLILCLPICDPLLQDCSEGQACYPIDDGFACAPDSGGEDGFYGDDCGFINDCDPGMYCMLPEQVPNCAGADGCCTPFCDTSDPGASAECPGSAGGQMCEAWYEEGQVPPGFENVGICIIPA